METKKIRILVMFGAIANGGVKRIISNVYNSVTRDLHEVDAVYHGGGLGFEEVTSLKNTGTSMTENPQFLTINWHSYQNWWKSFIQLLPYWVSLNSNGE